MKCVNTCGLSNILNTVRVQRTCSGLPNTSNIRTIKSESLLTTVRFKMAIQAVLMGKCADDVCNTSSVHLHLHLQCIFNVKGELFVLIVQRVSNCPAVVWWLATAGFCCGRETLASGLLCVRLKIEWTVVKLLVVVQLLSL